jgi:hypothetical protein
MTFRTNRLLQHLIIFLGFCLALPAQGEGGRVSPDIQTTLEKQRKKLAEKRSGESDMQLNMTPEERLAAGTRRGSKAHCRFVASCRPPKLLPGQSGTLMISAILQGDSVLPAPLQLNVTSRTPVDAINVGALTARSASIGTIAPAYVGRPVYENTAVFEVPITMGSSAELGAKQNLALDLQFDVYSGVSAQVIGRFVERVSVDIDVMQYHDPAVIGRAAGAQPRVDDPVHTEPVEPVASRDADSDVMATEDLNGRVNKVEVEMSEPSDASSDQQLPPTEGLPVPSFGFLIVGAGAVLLVIVIVLLRSKS